MKEIHAPLLKKEIEGLRAGEEVVLSGVIYTARDQAHKRIADLIKSKKELPIDLRDSVIYYCGPTPAKKGKVIGSCGPTTSARMDEFTPLMLKEGQAGMIGKGNRSKEVAGAIKKFKGVYFLTYAGCGAYLNQFIKNSELAAFEDLGPEAVYKLTVTRFPLIVAIDSFGFNIYS